MLGLPANADLRRRGSCASGDRRSRGLATSATLDLTNIQHVSATVAADERGLCFAVGGQSAVGRRVQSFHPKCTICIFADQPRILLLLPLSGAL